MQASGHIAILPFSFWPGRSYWQYCHLEFIGHIVIQFTFHVFVLAAKNMGLEKLVILSYCHGNLSRTLATAKLFFTFIHILSLYLLNKMTI